jgi:membrane protein DedA with SNARE-associated domain
MTIKEKLTNTLLWGFVLWFVGYVAGIALFMLVPKEYIGWFITPFATVLMVWVVLKKVRRPELSCYFGVGLLWTIMAVVLDYLFIVKLFNSNEYYKLDVFLYYALTLILPLCVGYWKYKKKLPGDTLF